MAYKLEFQSHFDVQSDYQWMFTECEFGGYFLPSRGFCGGLK